MGNFNFVKVAMKYGVHQTLKLGTNGFLGPEFSGQARGTRASSLPPPIIRNRGPLEAEGHHFGKIEANCSSAS